MPACFIEYVHEKTLFEHCTLYTKMYSPQFLKKDSEGTEH